MTDLAQKFELHPQQISNWKREFLDGAESVFANSKEDGKSEAEIEKERLLQTIGQQKVEIDFLKKVLS